MEESLLFSGMVYVVYQSNYVNVYQYIIVFIVRGVDNGEKILVSDFNQQNFTFCSLNSNTAEVIRCPVR